MPSVGRSRATPTQPSRDCGTEFQHPAPHRFVGDVETSLGQQFLNVAVAQGKAQIEPDRVLDDLGGEAMAPVAEQGHANILPDPPITPGPVSVTMPHRHTLPLRPLLQVRQYCPPLPWLRCPAPARQRLLSRRHLTGITAQQPSAKTWTK